MNDIKYCLDDVSDIQMKLEKPAHQAPLELQMLPPKPRREGLP